MKILKKNSKYSRNIENRQILLRDIVHMWYLLMHTTNLKIFLVPLWNHVSLSLDTTTIKIFISMIWKKEKSHLVDHIAPRPSSSSWLHLSLLYYLDCPSMSSPLPYTLMVAPLCRCPGSPQHTATPTTVPSHPCMPLSPRLPTTDIAPAPSMTTVSSRCSPWQWMWLSSLSLTCKYENEMPDDRISVASSA